MRWELTKEACTVISEAITECCFPPGSEIFRSGGVRGSQLASPLSHVTVRDIPYGASGRRKMLAVWVRTSWHGRRSEYEVRVRVHLEEDDEARASGSEGPDT